MRKLHRRVTWNWLDGSSGESIWFTRRRAVEKAARDFMNVALIDAASVHIMADLRPVKKAEPS